MSKVSCKTVGGQALIEGVMMRCEENKAIAIRKQDGTILVKKEKIPSLPKGDPRRWPLVRGVWMLIDSMIQGTKDINYSASFYAEVEEDEEPGLLDKVFNKLFGDKSEKVFSILTTVIAVVFAIGLFMVLPAFLAGKSGGAGDKNAFFSLREGLVKILLFIGYLFAMSQMKEVRRVFQYHGAEHKSVFGFEQQVELIPSKIKEMSRLHPRCGTNFIFVVLLISIGLFSFLNVRILWLRVLMKLALLPVVAGLGYECIRLAGKYQNPLSRALVFPGLMLQYITTKEPEEDQIEVALTAMKAALGEDGREEMEYILGDHLQGEEFSAMEQNPPEEYSVIEEGIVAIKEHQQQDMQESPQSNSVEEENGLQKAE